MTRTTPIATAQIGDELPRHSFSVRRADLVRYAAASGDANPIHLDDEVARSAGLPGVVAHGMLTMALAGRALTTWAGGVDAVIEYGVRFTRPVVVPDDGIGATVDVSGVLTDKPGDGTALISLTASCEGRPVLGSARARVRVRSEAATST